MYAQTVNSLTLMGEELLYYPQSLVTPSRNLIYRVRDEVRTPEGIRNWRLRQAVKDFLRAQKKAGGPTEPPRHYRVYCSEEELNASPYGDELIGALVRKLGAELDRTWSGKGGHHRVCVVPARLPPGVMIVQWAFEPLVPAPNQLPLSDVALRGIDGHGRVRAIPLPEMLQPVAQEVGGMELVAQPTAIYSDKTNRISFGQDPARATIVVSDWMPGAGELHIDLKRSVAKIQGLNQRIPAVVVDEYTRSWRVSNPVPERVESLDDLVAVEVTVRKAPQAQAAVALDTQRPAADTAAKVPAARQAAMVVGGVRPHDEGRAALAVGDRREPFLAAAHRPVSPRPVPSAEMVSKLTLVDWDAPPLAATGRSGSRTIVCRDEVVADMASVQAPLLRSPGLALVGVAIIRHESTAIRRLVVPLGAGGRPMADGPVVLTTFADKAFPEVSIDGGSTAPLLLTANQAFEVPGYGDVVLSAPPSPLDDHYYIFVDFTEPVVRPLRLSGPVVVGRQDNDAVADITYDDVLAAATMYRGETGEPAVAVDLSRSHLFVTDAADSRIAVANRGQTAIHKLDADGRHAISAAPGETLIIDDRDRLVVGMLILEYRGV